MVPVFRHIASSPACGNAIRLFAVVLALFAGATARGSELPARDEVHFVENRGQWNARARFCAYLPGSTVWVTDNSLVYDYYGGQKGHVVAMEFVGGVAASARANDPTEGIRTFITPERTVSSRLFGKVQLQRLYEGVDLVVHSDNGTVRYDFVVAPQASHKSIAIRFRGVEPRNITIDKTELSLGLSTGTVKHSGLFAYQTIDGRVVPVDCEFAQHRDGTIGFELGEYNKDYSLVIDPLVFSSMLGGSRMEMVQSLVTDSAGYIYITGHTVSSNFPTTPGAYKVQSQTDSTDAFVTKLDPTGRRLLFSTYLGGSRDDMGTAIAVTQRGEIVLTGSTRSFDFPTPGNPLDATYNGIYDIFYARLSKKGDSLLYATYLGGAQDDFPTDLALRGDTVYITGETRSDNFFPISPDALQRDRASAQDAFLTIFNTGGTALYYSSYFGGNSVDVANGIAIAPNGTIAIAGRTSSSNLPVSANAVKKEPASLGDAFDGFIAQFNPTARELVYCSYFGGTGNDEQIEAISYDRSGHLVVGGWTNSKDFPVTTGGFDTSPTEIPHHDGFLAVISSDSGILAATYFGGAKATTKIFDFAIDSSGGIFCTGITYSSSFPVTPGAFDGTYNLPSNGDAFLSYMTGDLDTMLYSTYFGGLETEAGLKVSIGPYRTAIIGGYTHSRDLPVRHGLPFSGAIDGFVGSFSMGAVMLSPNGNEALCAGSGFLIEWSANSLVKTVSIIASQAGKSDIIIASDIPASAGRMLWQIPDDIPGGNYRIRIIDGDNRLLDVTDTTFALHSRAVFSIHPTSVQRCPGNNIDLECRALAFPDPSYQWQKLQDGVWMDIPGATNRYLAIYGLDPSLHNGQYRAQAKTACGYIAYSNVAEISTYPLPGVQTHPSPQIGCPGTTVTFKARSSDPMASIHWEYRTPDSDTWMIMHGETTEELVLRNIGTHQNHWEYRAVFHNICDNKTAPARLAVHPFPMVSEHPVNDTVCSGARATFSITTPTPLAAIQWQMSRDLAEWENIPSATASSYVTWQLGETDNGLYFRALVRNGCETFAISQAAQAILHPMPLVELSAEMIDFGTLGFCTDDSVISIRITNRSTSPLHFGTPIQDVGHFGVQYSPAMLAPDATDSITVRFAPTSVPVDIGSILFLPVGGCSYRIAIPLKGRKAAAPVVSTISFVDFGTFPSCAVEPADTMISITIVNTGSVAITLHNGDVRTPFRLVPERAFPILLQPTEAADFDLHYNYAGAAGSDREFVLIPFSTVSSCSDTLRVEARGRREAPSISLPDTVYFPAMASCSTAIDTVLRIVNTGNVPVRLGTEALIVGKAFTVDYPEGRLLQSGDVLELPVSFRPASDGTHDGSLSFVLAPCGTTHTIEFIGSSATPQLTANASTLVFSRSVLSHTVVFANTGPIPLTVSAIDVDRPGYSLATRDLPCVLGPNESISVDVDFTGAGDPTDATLQAVSDTPCPLIVPVDIEGEAPPPPAAHIAIPVQQRKLGEVFSLPLLIDTSGVEALNIAGAASFRAEFAFNATMMTPVDPSRRGELKNGLHIITLEGRLDDRQSDTLSAMLMTAALGNASFTDVEIRSFTWLDEQSNVMDVPTELQQGGLHITNIKKGQHVNPSDSPFAVSIAPLPADETISLAIDHVPSLVGATLEVFDATGVRIDDWTAALAALPGSAETGYGGTIHKNISALAAGVYFCRLSLWNYSLVRPFVIR